VTYNGEGFDSFEVARTSAYISQTDEHQAELTVRETFDFAARCLGVGHKQGEEGDACVVEQCVACWLLTCMRGLLVPWSLCVVAAVGLRKRILA
jgi:hypothetical protein